MNRGELHSQIIILGLEITHQRSERKRGEERRKTVEGAGNGGKKKGDISWPKDRCRRRKTG